MPNVTTLNVNGKKLRVDVDSQTPLLYVLRDYLNLTGTKYGCGEAKCGACTVLIEGQAMRSVILPQAIRLVIPTLVTQLVALLKDSTLGYVVSYPELMKQAQNLTVYTHLLVQTYLIVAAIYVVVNLLLSRFAVWLERRLGSRTSSRAARGQAAEPEGVPQTMA